jgi:lipopolysaccharide transport system ATP-binding protein
MKPAVRVENLSKEYRIGSGPKAAYRTLRESLTEALAAPWRRLRRAVGGDGGAAADSHWALKDVSFEIPQGEIVGVIGRNGAGKSTLLKVLSRITEPTTGRVELRGRVGSLLEVGTGFHPELTGRENIYLNGAILGMTRREITRQFDDIVAFAEIDRFLDTPVKRYSSGMYVRLAFAVAAHIMPETLLIDEVLAVGDAAFQKKCLGKMGEVARQGRTILFVSHNIAAVETLCKTGLLLERGRLAACGPVGPVMRQYMQGLQEPVRQLGSGAAVEGPAVSFQSVELLRNGVERTETLQTGDPVTIRVKMDVRQPQRGMYLGVGLLDDWGRVVCALHSREAGLVLDREIGGALELNVELPRLLLLPGLFHVRLIAVGSGGDLDEGRVLQEVPSALSFHVLPKDFSGNGHCFVQGHGLALMPFRMRASCDAGEWEAEVLTGEEVEASAPEPIS